MIEKHVIAIQGGFIKSEHELGHAGGEIGLESWETATHLNVDLTFLFDFYTSL